VTTCSLHFYRTSTSVILEQGSSGGNSCCNPSVTKLFPGTFTCFWCILSLHVLTCLVSRPRNTKDVQDAVRLHARIQGNGVGHSWNRPFFCSTPNTTTLQPPASGLQANVSSVQDGAAANIVMATIRPLTIQVRHVHWARGGCSNNTHRTKTAVPQWLLCHLEVN
jgi:hypothetical protein